MKPECSCVLCPDIFAGVWLDVEGCELHGDMGSQQ